MGLGRRPTPIWPSSSACDAPLDVRPVALAGAAWGGAAFGTTTGPVWWTIAAVIAAGALAVAGWRRQPLLAAVAAVGLVCLGVAAARVVVIASDPVARWASERAIVTVTVRVGEGRLAGAGPGGPSWIVPVVVEQVEGRGQSLIGGPPAVLSVTGERQRAWQAVPPGSRVRAVVRLSAADEGSVAAWASARSAPEQLGTPSPIDAAVNVVRAGLRHAVAGLPRDAAALVPALVVGDTSAMPATLVDQFRATGLTHLTAVSGANLTLLLAVVLWLSGRLGVLGWWRRLVALAVVAGFVLLCRGEPSVVRAAAMGAVGLAGLGWAGPRQGLRYLAWAVVLLMLLDPWLALSIGFALSVLASAGIVVFAQRWSMVLAGWLPSWLAEAVAVPIAAQLATQPVVTSISGQVSVVGLAANLAAAPLVGPATVLGLAAAAASVVAPPVAVGLGWAAGGFAQALCWIAAVGAALPGSWMSWPTSVVAVSILVAACVIAVATMPWLLARPWAVGLAMLGLVLVTIRPVNAPGWPPPAWSIVSCDVGQGDATVVSAGSGAAVVVDAGPDPGPIKRCLDQLGVQRVPWLVFTHPHADHIGGVAGIRDGRVIERMLLPGTNPSATGWKQVRAQIAGVPVVEGWPGVVVSAGKARLTVVAERPFSAPAVLSPESAEENDSSLVMRVEAGGVSAILAGDVEETGQTAAVGAASGLASDVLVVPHHGSAHQADAFFAAVAPRLALISVGKDNSYGHPAASTLGRIARLAAEVHRTDEAGAIAVARSPDGQLIVTQQRSG